MKKSGLTLHITEEEKEAQIGEWLMKPLTLEMAELGLESSSPDSWLTLGKRLHLIHISRLQSREQCSGIQVRGSHLKALWIQQETNYFGRGTRKNDLIVLHFSYGVKVFSL